MKLKLRKISLDAGRPVAFINEQDARILNAHVDDRVEIISNGKKIIAIVDTVRGFIGKGEISLSKEIIDYLNLKNGELVEVNPTIEPRSSRLIAKKLSGKKLSKSEIACIVSDMVNNALTEAEIAYFVSGVYEHGMDMNETIYLTEAIYKTGEIINWGNKKIADKHSIGGRAGNRTTPIIVSICAAGGVIMPKTSSRAITSASGTADVIETIANVNFPVARLKEIVNKTGACLAWGGSLGLAPADDKLIRVERLLNLDPESQLIASIIAKKLAVGSKYILIDIPYGEKAKVNKKEAESLKKKFIKIGKHFKLKIKVVLTDGSQPIGNGIGPVLEMQDVLRVLKQNNPPADLEKKSVMLAGEIFEMIHKSKPGKGSALAREILHSGKALKKFEEIISAQGKKSSGLYPAKIKHEIVSSQSGKVISIDNKSINLLGRILGCPVDKSAGLYIHRHKSEKKMKETIKLFHELKPFIMSRHLKKTLP
jgi:AMP phosphorylase